MLVKVLVYLAVYFFFFGILAAIFIHDTKKAKADKDKEDNK